MPRSLGIPRQGAPTLRDTACLIYSSFDRTVLRRLTLSGIFVLMAAALTALTPVALKVLVDAVAAGGPATMVSLWLTAYVGGWSAARALTEVRSYVFSGAEQRLAQRLARRVFKHVLDLPLRYHLERQTGAISEVLANGLQGCQQIVHHTVVTALPVAVEIVVAAVVLTRLGQPWLIAILLAALAAYGCVFGHGTRRLVAPAHAISSARIEAHSTLADSLLNYEAIKHCAAEGPVGQRYDRALDVIASQWAVFFGRKAVNGLAAAAIFAAALATALLLAGYGVASSTLTIGDFVLVNAYLFQLMRPAEMLAYASQDVARSFAFSSRMITLLNEQTESQDHTFPVRRDARFTRGELTFDQVSLSYQVDRPALRGVSFSVRAGQTVGIVGSSGAGKSSLVRLLLRLYDPDSGRILLDGEPLTSYSRSMLRQGIALVPQDIILFNDTIAYNIGFGRLDCTEHDIERAARLAQLHDFIRRLPLGYETRVGERGLKLSGGEKQRIAIARAILKAPRIFIFDEATSSLDSRTEESILHSLKVLACGYTTLIIAHRLSTVANADRIIVLDGGAVSEQGTHQELLARRGRYAALWDVQNRLAFRAS